VVTLWAEVFAGDPPRNEPRAVIRRKLRVQRELFLVGEFAGDTIGTVIAGFDGYRGWVYHLAVHPRCRRRGFGRALMRHAEVSLKAIGCPKLNLQVRSTNADVIAFYERLGYSIEERASLGKILE
jgi:ribosomal protein S18 acetylase RimI-like enzyme